MSEFEQLRQYLRQDPENDALLQDCAEAAINERKYEEAIIILKPLVGKGNSKSINLMGLIDLKRGNFEAAERTFNRLMQEGEPDDSALRFNLAWSQANLKKYSTALESLTDKTAQTLPQAAMLRIQLLHQLGQFDDAANLARKYTSIFPNDSGLAAAASTIAMDIDDPKWARELAACAPDIPEAKITIATLNLSENTAEDAAKLFDEVLSVQPKSARALIGKGLSQMLLNDPVNASENLDRGAESFGTHLGSWVAAGWSHATQGNWDIARARFEHALSIDDTFSETHGSLGILDIMEGDIPSGQKRIRTARRLDPDCASAALGQILILQNQGREGAAKEIFEKAMNTPIDATGKTLSQAMISMGMSGT